MFQDIVNTRPIRRERRIESETVVYEKIPIHARSRYMLWAVAIASLAFLLLALSFFWASAEIQVFPKIEDTQLNENLSANKDTAGELTFDLVVLSGEKSKELTASEEKELTTRASGSAIIFNAYSSAPQRLDIDTRLSGSNGKLYKTKTATTVPGMKTDGTPGSVEVEIYATEPGEEYNSGPLDFNIVGFKGTPKYEKFKVRSKPNTEISGGFRGVSMVASDADKQTAVGELKTALEEELFNKAKDQIPAGFILFRDAAYFRVNKVDMPLGQEELKLTLSGTLQGILLKEEELTKKIATKKITDYQEEDVFISNIRDLKFSLSSPADTALTEAPIISFNLSGPAQIVWKLDEEKFKADLLGQPKKSFSAILSQYKNINRAELSLSPLWSRTLPEKLEKLDVVINYPE